ncbi:unnamed protein product [Effrenium voratum]|nr:unnamed protein product [Effrenium voratum]
MEEFSEGSIYDVCRVFGSCPEVMYLLKLAFRSPRPEAHGGSCAKSCGMPSGHTIETIGSFTWLALEVYHTRTLEPRQKVLLMSVAGVCLLPSGWSRIYLHDHSLEQVWAGALVGTTLAVAWYFLLTTRVARWLIKLLLACLPLKRNYPLDQIEEAPWAPVAPRSYGSAAKPGAEASEAEASAI